MEEVKKILPTITPSLVGIVSLNDLKELFAATKSEKVFMRVFEIIYKALKSVRQEHIKGRKENCKCKAVFEQLFCRFAKFVGSEIKEQVEVEKVIIVFEMILAKKMLAMEDVMITTKSTKITFNSNYICNN